MNDLYLNNYTTSTKQKPISINSQLKFEKQNSLLYFDCIRKLANK